MYVKKIIPAMCGNSSRRVCHAGLLAIRVPKPPENEDEQLLGGQPEPTRHWRLGHLVGLALILIGVLQSAAGIAGQILHPSAAK